MHLRTWAAKHGVSMAALVELENDVLGLLGTPGVVHTGKSEAHAQSLIRLDAARSGVLLFRNNVGALQDESGRVVRYGLANESKAENERIKSADLIGIRRVTILPEMVGGIIGQFVSREAKESDWHYTGADREPAQLAWAKLISAHGGDAKFATGEGSFK